MQKTLLREQRGLLTRMLPPSGRLSWLLSAVALLLGSTQAQAQLSGAKAIPGSGSTGYATLAAAITDLNTQGVGAGGVTFNLAPGYTETASNLLLTATGTAANPIVFQKGTGAGANPTITAGLGTSITLDAIIGLQGSDYVTFDGLMLLDPAANTTVTSQMEWGFALLKASTPAVDGCQNVVIKNCAVTLRKGTASMGIYANNHTPASITPLTPTTAAGTNSNNKFYGNTISSVNNGIYVAGYAAASPYTFYDQNNEIGSIVSGTTATGNAVTDFGTTATAYGIYAIYQNGVKVQGNTVATAGTPTTTALPTSTVYGVYVNIGGNTDVLNNTLAMTFGGTTSTMYGIQNNSGGNGLGGAAATANIVGNSLTMNSATATSSSFYGIYNTINVANLNISGNLLNNWSRPSTTGGSNYLIYVSTGATATQNVFDNTISNFATAGALSSVYGVYGFNASTVAAQYYGNTLQNISNDGNTTYAMYLSGGNTLDVYRNRVSGIASNGASASSYGMYVVGATTTNLTNNLIGDFATPTSSNTFAQAGLYISGGTTVNAQYNSIYLNGTSTGANFGTTGMYYPSGTTSAITLRNNVVVNTSTAAGTGSTVALRRGSGTAGVVPTNLLSATNNNLYYAGVPSATNLVYAEGITAPVNAMQYLVDYKSFLAGRESNSVSENPPFVSTSGTNANFLKVSTTVPTQIESGGVAISGITTDFAGTARNATSPDLGAYEGTYQALDLTGPNISATTLNNTASTANRTVVVTITDPSGVATGTNAPRLYYRKGTTGAFVFVNATSVSGSQYTFTMNYALVTGGSVAAGDLIQYYVAAQDLVGTPNTSTSPGGGSGSTPPGTTAPATPSSFQIVGALSGVYYVGTGTSPDPTRTYATLTAAANAYNINVLTGATTFYLLDATYAGETFPITFNANPAASATNTLLIKPYTGVNSAIISSTAATALVLLNGADYITIDGANTATGTTRNLTLTSGNSGASTVLWVGSLGANAGATNITLRNLNVVGGSTSNTSSFGIYASASPVLATTAPSAFTYGDDNDNLVIQNNALTTAYEAIFAKGNTVATSYDGLQIIENRIGAALSGTLPAAADNVLYKGIDIQGATAPLISRNVVLGMDASAVNTNIAAIELNGNVTNAVISRNSITGLRELSTSGYGAYGINLNSTTNITNTEISNNVIADILTAAYNASTTYNPYGIRLTGGTGTKVYYNTVNLFGSITPTSNYASPSNLSAALLVTSSSVTGLDVRNNIFSNSITTSAATSTVKAYAVYHTAASSLTTSNYNDYFVSGPNGVLGYVAADVATLAALRTATTQDANSISTDPIFVLNTNLLPAAGQIANGGTPVSVTVDYNGATRNATTPSLGAFQFTPQAIDVAPNALLSPVNSTTSTCFGANTPVTVQIRNNGSSNLDFATNPLMVTVVISGPGSSTQALTQLLSTGTLASAATQNITLTSLANFTPLGVYTFAITATVTGDLNTSNDLLTPAPTLNVAAPVVGALSPTSYSICVSGATTLTLAGAANGSIQFQSSSSATGPFTNVTGATTATFTTPTLTTTTYYRAQVTCGTNVVTSNVSAITVNNPVISAAPSPLSTCAGGTVTLSATTPTGVSVRYFTTATGGTAVGTGSPFVSSVLTSNTTFYAEAFAGGQEFVGPTRYNSTTFGPQTGGALYFTTTGPTTLANVTVFLNAGQAAGTVTIDLRTGSSTSGAIVNGQSRAFAVPAGPATGVAPYVVPLNYAIPATGPYTLYLASATQGGLLRDDSGANIAYPYTSPSGAVTITGPNSAGYYYYFYNMQFGSECVGATRTPIVVNVTPGLVASLPVAAATICGNTPYQLAGTIAGTSTGATYTSSGTGTFSPNATTLSATYTPSAADIAAGTVTLTLTPTGPAAPCTSVGRVVLTLVTPPNAAFSYPSGTYCTGSATTVAPVLAVGAVSGTFSTTGTGLRLDPVTGAINLATQIATGTYTITNTVATAGVCNGTTSTATITIIAGVPAPTLTAFALPGGGVQLSTNPVAGVLYQFFVNGVAVGPPSANFTVTVPTVPVNGTYTVTLVVPGGCTSAPSTPVLITATAVASLNGVSLRVYPNPTADGQLTVALQGFAAKAAPLTVLNALGQVVHTGTATVGEANLNLAKLASGVYTVRVQTPDGVLTQRVVRQ